MSVKGHLSFSGISDLMARGRSGRYGDLRLLGLSLGIILLCAVALLVLQARSSSEKASASPVSTAVAAPSVGVQPAAQEPTIAVYETGSAVAQPHLLDQRAGPHGIAAAPLSPEEHRRMLREMAEQIPEGQTIVF